VLKFDPPPAFGRGQFSSWKDDNEHWNRNVVQSSEGIRLYQPDDGSQDIFVHISAVERSDIGNLLEGQKVSFELERGDRGKTAAVNLKQS
jgi:cold shock protein